MCEKYIGNQRIIASERFHSTNAKVPDEMENMWTQQTKKDSKHKRNTFSTIVHSYVNAGQFQMKWQTCEQ